jgi:WD40 repeat protein
VTSSEDRSARIWDSVTGTLLTVLDGARFLCFSPPGDRIVIESSKGNVQVLDAATRSLMKELKVSRGLQGASFSPDGNLILTRGERIEVWDASSGAPISAFESTMEWLNGEFSPDSKHVVTASREGSRVWDVRTGQQIRELERTAISRAMFSPDGQQIVTASMDNTEAKVWNAPSGSLIDALKGPPGFSRPVSFSPDGSRIAAVYSNGTGWLWDLRPRYESTILRGHTDRINFVAISPDGERIATASNDHTVRIWDLHTGNSLFVLKKHQDVVRSVAFSPDGTRIATASEDNTARVWDSSTGSEIAILEGHQDKVISVSFSPDGQRILTASWDGTARLWDAKTGTCIAVLKGHTNGLNSAAFSPDGKRIVTASADGTARVWSSSGDLLAVLTGHTREIWHAEFSPDARQILTASADLSASVWDARYKPQFVLKLDGLTGWSSGVSAEFSPDGKRILTGGMRMNQLHVWDAENGDLLTTVTSPNRDDVLGSPRFSADGKTVVALDHGHFRLWDAKTATEVGSAAYSEYRFHGVQFSSNGLLMIGLAGRDVVILPVDRKEDIATYSSVAAFRRLTSNERAEHFLDDETTTPNSDHADPRATECDRLAAHPLDPQKVATGVNFNLITDEAVEACRKALATQPTEPRLMFQLGRALLKKGELNEAYALYGRAAEHGYAAAHSGLAIAYEKGKGDLHADAQAAIRHYQAAWDAGMTAVSVNLATIYWNGELVPRNRDQAFDWLRKGANAGFAGAHNELASRYERGDGVDSDLTLALYHYIVATQLFERARDEDSAQTARYRRAALARNMPVAEVVKINRQIAISH